MSRETILYANAKKASGTILAAALMTLLSLFLLLYSTKSTILLIFSKIAGGLGFLFFGWCLILTIGMLRRRKPLLILNREGITDQSSFLSLGFLPWSSVTDISRRFFASQEYLCLEISDYKERKKSLSGFRRFLIAVNGRMGLPPVCISLNLTDTPAEEVLAAAEEFRLRQEESAVNNP